MADSKEANIESAASEEFNKPKSIEVQVVEVTPPQKPNNMDVAALDNICGEVKPKNGDLSVSKDFNSEDLTDVSTNSISEDISNEKPSLTDITLDLTVQEYANPAFEFGDEGASGGKFVEIVDHILKQPSVDDLHPYGRGNLYANIFRSNDLHDYTDGGKLISWVVVVILLVGFAGGIVMLAITWETEQLVLGNTQTMNSSSPIR